MMLFVVVLLLVNQLVAAAVTHKCTKRFPANFKFSTATASYQIEGGWNLDGKGENIWDTYSHSNPPKVANNDTGDVACDSYHKFKEDVAMLKHLGVQRYRFSLSWSRILPTGYTNITNQAGIDYYKNLLQELKANNIEPMITIYHWDLPQPIQDIGGWTNPDIIEIYASYARLAFKLFGDDVKLWVTINEPKQVYYYGYGVAYLAPGISDSGIGEYKCTHNLLKAHARAWHIYDEEFRALQKGRVSIVMDSDWSQPGADTPEDETAAETRLQFMFGWFANPIFNGNYPQVMIDRIAKRSALEGFDKSRLPEFTQEEIEYIKGTHDYLGLNHYTTSLVNATTAEPPIGVPSFNNDLNVITYQDPSWESAASPWLKVVPWGVRKLLKWIHKTYNAPEIIITENGISDSTGTLTDDRRINYYREYLRNILEAMTEDEVNVSGYTAWSLMDNFEWIAGYTQKFGLYQVDFNSPSRTRTPKKSAWYYKKVIASRCVD